MSERIAQVSYKVIKRQIKKLVCERVEKIRNEILETEAERVRVIL